MQIRDRITEDLVRRARDEERLEEALERQRETVERMRLLVEDEPSELHVGHLGREVGRLGDQMLLAGGYEDALALVEEAAAIWRRMGRDKACLLAELDAAEATFELGRREEALSRLDRLVEKTESGELEVYRDFALALRGRLRARGGEIECALDDLEAAQRIRTERGNDRQIEETEWLIELVARRS